MRMRSKLQWRGRLLRGAAALMLAVIMGLSVDGLSMVGHAESQARVKVTSARIRSEASTNGAQVGSALKDKVLTVTGQERGEDGYTWYEVQLNGSKGYIRSDLVELIEGETPPSTSTAATPVPEAPAVVTEVNPVSATVKSGTSVRVRSNASTNSDVKETVSKGLAVTVIGQAEGINGDGVWYQVSYISGNKQITGFIRSDFLTLSGEATPLTPQQPDTTPEPVADATPAPQQEQKKYDTINQEGKWKVYDTSTNLGWDIEELINGAKGNGDLYAESQKTVKSQKIVIIILVILLVGASAGVAYLIFKLKDTMDSVYFNQVETETLRRRSTAASQGGSQRVTHTVGAERQAARPSGAQAQRPSGTAQGQRPSGTAQGQRPSGTAQGQRPSGAAQGQRPSGTAQGQRPSGAAQGQRPAGTAQGQRPAGAVSDQRPSGTPQGQKPPVARQSAAPKSQPKNFMADEDDEFEFEFLSVDGDDRK